MLITVFTDPGGETGILSYHLHWRNYSQSPHPGKQPLENKSCSAMAETKALSELAHKEQASLGSIELAWFLGAADGARQ